MRVIGASVERKQFWYFPATSREIRSWGAVALLFVVILATTTSGAHTVVYGPKTYTGTGRPVLKTNSFTVPKGGSGYTLHVANKGVGVALVILNGRIVLRPSDFVDPPERAGRDDDPWRPEWNRMQRKWRDRNDRTVDTIDKSVRLVSGKNEIVVAFISRVGTSFTLQIATPAVTSRPTITPIPSPAPNAAGWNNTNVTVSFSCTNATTCPGPVTVTTEGANQVVSATANGPGGSATTQIALNIDKTPPVVTATSAPLANAAGWNNTPVTVTFTASDTLSRVAPGTLTAPATLSIDGTNLSASGEATDLAGNIGTFTLNGINIDTANPAMAVALLPPPNANGWNNSPVTLHFSCSDSGSGIDSCPPDQVLSSDGENQTFSGIAADRAGNATILTSTVNIDQTTPNITAVASPQPNAGGWNNSDVVVGFQCNDTGSGIAVCPSSQLLTLEGAGQVAHAVAVDVASNVSSTSATVNMDKTPPGVLVASPADGSTVADPHLVVTGSINDALSGVGDVTCNGTVAAVANGTFACFVTLVAGPNTLRVHASDVAGNAAEMALSVTLDEAGGPNDRIGHVTVDPMTIPAAASTLVTISVGIPAAPSLIPASVKLLRYDAAGGLPTDLGPMFDDGTHGDSTSGDNIYTTQRQFVEPSSGLIALRVAASFADSNDPMLSPPALLPVFMASSGEVSRSFLVASLRAGDLVSAYSLLGNRLASNHVLDGLDASAIAKLVDALNRCTVALEDNHFQVCVGTATTDGTEYRFFLVPDETGRWRILAW